jgi:outer membrane protein
MLRRAFLLLLLSATAAGQTFPAPKYFQRFFARPNPSALQLPAPTGLESYVVDGKLRLSLADAIELTLANNTDIKLSQLQLDTARNALMRSYAPFDPVLTSSFSPSRSTSPSTSQLQGAATLSSLNQNFSSNYSQLFQSGTLYQVGLSTSRSASNSLYSTVNPSIFSALNVSLTQNLLRNRGFFAARAPITIAQRNLQQTRATFAAQVNDSLSRAINQYWDVVQARESLKVVQDALDMAEATYKQNKRALELGALPPLDIYRSESQVAQRKLQLIQSEYALRQVEDDFRRTIGADLDPRMAALDLVLTESAAPSGEMAAVDLPTALQTALQSRPELEALKQQAAIDDTNLRLAHNNLLPDLTVSSYYTMNGVGGNQIDTSGAAPVVMARGGIADAFDQLSSMNYPSYGLSVTLRLPLRNRGAEADLGNALVSKRRDLYQLRQRQQAITLEVRNAVNQLEQAKLSVAAAKLARDLAQKNLQAEQRKYELGAQTIFFVLDAQTQLSAAEQSLVQAQISYQRALVAMDRATGQLLAKNKVDIAP